VIGYADTSAMVPLLVAEPSSAMCRRFWDDADTIVASRLIYVEAAAALAQAERMLRLSAAGHTEAVAILDVLWRQVHVLEIDEPLVRRAGMLARRLGLRGYDAVHCATAEAINDQDVVAATGDRRLLDAWCELGLDTFDTNQSA
jgi:hypothetical protein